MASDYTQEDLQRAASDLMFDCKTLRVPMIAFSPDGRTLVSTASTGTARVWDLRSRVQVFELTQPSNSVRAVAFSPDGRMIVTGADDRTVRVFDAKSGSQLRAIEGLPWAVFDLKFHPGGKVLFAIGRGGELVAIDPIAGSELAKLTVHGKIAFSIGISRDGRRIYTCGQDPWVGVIDLDRLRSYIRGNEAFWRAECNVSVSPLPDAGEARTR